MDLNAQQIHSMAYVPAALVTPPSAVVPMVIENTGRVERAFDIYSLLLRERIVFLGTPIDDQIANVIVAQLLYLDREDPEKDIHLYINSPGGVVSAGLAIYDTMQAIRPNIHTYCLGLAASMASILLVAGTKGMRYALDNSEVMIHQPMGGISGQAVDMEIEARRILRIRESINKILAKHSGQSIERVRLDSDRNFWLTGREAKDYGLVDEVLPARKFGSLDKAMEEDRTADGKSAPESKDGKDGSKS
jgi:ATP-dependent Clp protease protease subunit